MCPDRKLKWWHCDSNQGDKEDCYQVREESYSSVEDETPGETQVTQPAKV